MTIIALKLCPGESCDLIDGQETVVQPNPYCRMFLKYNLLSFLYGQNRVFYQTGFVSHHAARAFGTCYAADAIRSLPKECTLQTNPEARG
jgi:hypothetical protein